MYANNNTGKDTLKKKLELENAKEKAEDNNLESNKIKTTSKSNFRIISITTTVSHENDEEISEVHDGGVEMTNDRKITNGSSDRNDLNDTETLLKAKEIKDIKSNPSLNNIISDNPENRNDSC